MRVPIASIEQHLAALNEQSFKFEQATRSIATNFSSISENSAQRIEKFKNLQSIARDAYTDCNALIRANTSSLNSSLRELRIGLSTKLPTNQQTATDIQKCESQISKFRRLIAGHNKALEKPRTNQKKTQDLIEKDTAQLKNWEARLENIRNTPTRSGLVHSAMQNSVLPAGVKFCKNYSRYHDERKDELSTFQQHQFGLKCDQHAFDNEIRTIKSDLYELDIVDR